MVQSSRNGNKAPDLGQRCTECFNVKEHAVGCSCRLKGVSLVPTASIPAPASSKVAETDVDSPKILTLKARMAELEATVASLTPERAKLVDALTLTRAALEASTKALLALTALLAPRVPASQNAGTGALVPDPSNVVTPGRKLELD
jgi:hypothetical protein